VVPLKPSSTTETVGLTTVHLEAGQRVHIPGDDLSTWVTIDDALPLDGESRLYVKDDGGVVDEAPAAK
jgi:hypothetical protein